MKKLLAAILASAMVLGLCACGQSAAPAEAPAAPAATEASSAQAEAPAETYKVAIVKQLDHASLDEIANAIAAELDAITAEGQIAIEYEIYSGQNDQTVLKQIGDQCIADKVDAIIPIATLAAQVMTTCAEDTKTPVIYAAISDPEAAELTGIEYVSGTSDALNTNTIMDMIFEVKPEAKKIGLLYSLSETNSAKPIAEAKAYLESKNIEFVEATGNTNDEVISAVSVLVSENVDAIFTPTDNVVMAAELAIADTLIEAKIPHFTGADSFVRNGGFTTCGVNYTDLGTATANYAMKAIIEGTSSLEDYYLMDGGIVTVNTETAAGIGLDYSVFAKFGEIVEVLTTEE